MKWIRRSISRFRLWMDVRRNHRQWAARMAQKYPGSKLWNCKRVSLRDLLMMNRARLATRHIPAVGSDWASELKAWMEFLRSDSGYYLVNHSRKFVRFAIHYNERIATDPLVDELNKQLGKRNDTGTKTT